MRFQWQRSSDGAVNLKIRTKHSLTTARGISARLRESHAAKLSFGWAFFAFMQIILLSCKSKVLLHIIPTTLPHWVQRPQRQKPCF